MEIIYLKATFKSSDSAPNFGGKKGEDDWH